MKIKNCRVCESNNTHITDYIDDGNFVGWYVICGDCGLKGPMSKYSINDAISGWNWGR